MKFSLSLIRHAKSSWEFPLDDRLRPLNERGITNAENMRKELLRQQCMPQKIYSSPAVRARATAKLITANQEVPFPTLEIVEELYTFDVNDLERFVKKMKPEYTEVFLFGHNNAITDFVNKFGDLFIPNVPTAAWVTIAFEAESWASITKGKTIRFITPSALQNDKLT
ncbi:SixA phosphatase family protein [Flavobacterium sp.]|jgi:phosphohistidine phosphatase|uniref:SixA phosphatase family protein n=1 Tax=Flavobacterium sp. TaxID=239 RepID=UPI0022C3A846|nr:phosphoglycerate mutase family protein [Flavobacterium sp.]MCZ8145027.1 phosphoglycerate mutase family protein [Flavobacterium sp.]MCZ8368029.1 phosphoglycerate mutase family protein [Flavobacterium sp.]